MFRTVLKMIYNPPVIGSGMESRSSDSLTIPVDSNINETADNQRFVSSSADPESCLDTVENSNHGDAGRRVENVNDNVNFDRNLNQRTTEMNDGKANVKGHLNVEVHREDSSAISLASEGDTISCESLPSERSAMSEHGVDDVMANEPSPDPKNFYFLTCIKKEVAIDNERWTKSHSERDNVPQDEDKKETGSGKQSEECGSAPNSAHILPQRNHGDELNHKPKNYKFRTGVKRVMSHRAIDNESQENYKSKCKSQKDNDVHESRKDMTALSEQVSDYKFESESSHKPGNVMFRNSPKRVMVECAVHKDHQKAVNCKSNITSDKGNVSLLQEDQNDAADIKNKSARSLLSGHGDEDKCENKLNRKAKKSTFKTCAKRVVSEGAIGNRECQTQEYRTSIDRSKPERDIDVQHHEEQRDVSDSQQNEAFGPTASSETKTNPFRTCARRVMPERPKDKELQLKKSCKPIDRSKSERDIDVQQHEEQRDVSDSQQNEAFGPIASSETKSNPFRTCARRVMPERPIDKELQLKKSSKPIDKSKSDRDHDVIQHEQAFGPTASGETKNNPFRTCARRVMPERPIDKELQLKKSSKPIDKSKSDRDHDVIQHKHQQDVSDTKHNKGFEPIASSETKNFLFRKSVKKVISERALDSEQRMKESGKSNGKSKKDNVLQHKVKKDASTVCNTGSVSSEHVAEDEFENDQSKNFTFLTCVKKVMSDQAADQKEDGRSITRHGEEWSPSVNSDRRAQPDHVNYEFEHELNNLKLSTCVKKGAFVRVSQSDHQNEEKRQTNFKLESEKESIVLQHEGQKELVDIKSSELRIPAGSIQELVEQKVESDCDVSLKSSTVDHKVNNVYQFESYSDADIRYSFSQKNEECQADMERMGEQTPYLDEKSDLSCSVQNTDDYSTSSDVVNQGYPLASPKEKTVRWADEENHNVASQYEDMKLQLEQTLVDLQKNIYDADDESIENTAQSTDTPLINHEKLNGYLENAAKILEQMLSKPLGGEEDQLRHMETTLTEYLSSASSQRSSSISSQDSLSQYGFFGGENVAKDDIGRARLRRSISSQDSLSQYAQDDTRKASLRSSFSSQTSQRSSISSQTSQRSSISSQTSQRSSTSSQDDLSQYVVFAAENAAKDNLAQSEIGKVTSYHMLPSGVVDREIGIRDYSAQFYTTGENAVTHIMVQDKGSKSVVAHVVPQFVVSDVSMKDGHADQFADEDLTLRCNLAEDGDENEANFKHDVDAKHSLSDGFPYGETTAAEESMAEDLSRETGFTNAAATQFVPIKLMTRKRKLGQDDDTKAFVPDDCYADGKILMIEDIGSPWQVIDDDEKQEPLILKVKNSMAPILS